MFLLINTYESDVMEQYVVSVKQFITREGARKKMKVDMNDMFKEDLDDWMKEDEKRPEMIIEEDRGEIAGSYYKDRWFIYEM